MISDSIKILLISDNEDDYLLFRDMLSDIHGREFDLQRLTDGEAGLAHIERGGCDICLVDNCLKGRTGLDLLKDSANPGSREPIIFLMDRYNLDLDIEAMRSGASNCLVKEGLTAPSFEHSLFHALECKKRKDELLMARRVTQSLNACCEAVIRIKDEIELLGEICRIIVEIGGYTMAWVGYAEHDESQSVTPVAKYGYEEGYLDTVNVTWSDNERGRGPTGTCIRTGAPGIVRFVRDDPNFEPWRQKAVARGYASVCALPMFQDGRAMGAITIYSSMPDAFEDKELELLAGLSNNLSHGVEALRTQKARSLAKESLRAAYTDLETRVTERTAELHLVNEYLQSEIDERVRMQTALKESALRSEALFQCNPIPTFTWQKKGDDFVLVNFNNAAKTITGGKVVEAIGKKASEIYSQRPDILVDIHTCAAAKGIIKKEGYGHLIPDRLIMLTLAFVPPDQVMMHMEDVTERKRSEKALQAAHHKLDGIIEFLPDATFVVDRERKVIAWNRAIEEMTGIPKEQIIGMSDYVNAASFFGEPGLLLIDLVMEKLEGQTDISNPRERQGKQMGTEAFAPRAYGGKGAFLWGIASPLFDEQGNVIGAIEAIRDITEMKHIESVLLKREADLAEKANQLEESNTALKVLLKRREEDRKDLEESLLTNVKESIMPFLEKLKKSHLEENQKTYIGIVESQLDEIVSPFLKRLSSRFTNLTPMEIKVAKLIKEGKPSKEIAEILGVAVQTILTHRNNLRAKLGLRNEKANLRSHLMSLA